MILNVLLLALGMLLHGAAAIILVVPIVLPLIHLLGIDPVHFGFILTLNLAIGQQTPPVASVLVTSCSIARTEIQAQPAVHCGAVCAADGGDLCSDRADGPGGALLPLMPTAMRAPPTCPIVTETEDGLS